jgi:hypothetical protein
MNRSDQINELVTALAKAQADVQDAKADKENPHFKSKYASLSSVWEACRKALTSNGLSIVQTIEKQEGVMGVNTMLSHASGQFICSFCPAVVSGQQNMQSLGSAISYARRYSLAAMVGVASSEETQEDDDGAKASQGGGRQNSRPQGKQKQAASPPPPGPKIEVEQKPGDFVMSFGKATKDKALKDCDVGDLQKALTWLKEQLPERLNQSEVAAKEALRAYFYQLELEGARQ